MKVVALLSTKILLEKHVYTSVRMLAVLFIPIVTSVK